MWVDYVLQLEETLLGEYGRPSSVDPSGWGPEGASKCLGISTRSCCLPFLGGLFGLAAAGFSCYLPYKVLHVLVLCIPNV